MNGKAETIRARVVHDTKALGVRRGGVVMVHSSVKALRLNDFDDVDNKLEEVLLGLLDAVGPEGTLLFPALTYKTVGPNAPRFDARSTPSCVGTFADFVRLRPGTLRSTHPTHSICAIGTRAAELTGLHHLDTTPVGPHSPLALLPKVGGQILMIGCTGRPNTSMHGVEELVEPPYLYSGITTDYECIDMNGQLHRMSVRGHGFKGFMQRYERVEDLLKPDEISRGNILAASCVLMDAAAVWREGEAALRRDPFCFVAATV